MNDEKPPHNKDKVIADSGWGIKPDDQPSRANDREMTFAYDPSDGDTIRKILQVQRRNFNTANKVVLQPGDSGGPGRLIVIDINGDRFIVEGLGYGDENLIEVMKHFGAAFDPRLLRQVPAGDTRTREYELSRVWAWGAERTG